MINAMVLGFGIYMFVYGCFLGKAVKRLIPLQREYLTTDMAHREFIKKYIEIIKNL